MRIRRKAADKAASPIQGGVAVALELGSKISFGSQRSMARGDEDQRTRLLPDDQIQDGVAVALLSN